MVYSKSGLGRVAQLAVHFIRNEGVVGSSPISTSKGSLMGPLFFAYFFSIIYTNQFAKFVKNQLETLAAVGRAVLKKAMLIRNHLVSFLS